jgi:neutral ceramidase
MTRTAIVGLDALHVSSAAITALRNATQRSGLVDGANLMVSSTHTHSAPAVDSGSAESSRGSDFERVRERLIETVREALQRLEPVTLRYGTSHVTGLISNRRYLYADGTVEMRGSRSKSDFVGPEGPAKGLVQLLTAHRSDGALAGGFVGFACHPDTMFHLPVWSADFAGALCESLVTRFGAPFVFLQGASGDIQANCWLDWSGSYAADSMVGTVSHTRPKWREPCSMP